jgi:hypothetical protein
MDYKFNVIEINRQKIIFPWISTARQGLTSFTRQGLELQAKLIEYLEVDDSRQLSVNLTLSINDYSVRDQTITVLWDISTVQFSIHNLIIGALWELCYRDKIKTDNEDMLERWTWEVRQIIDEVIQDKVEIEQEERL